MANPQLVDYIKSQLAVGVTKDDLRKAIADAGWTSADAQAAFDVVEGKAPTMPVVPIPRPQPPQPKPMTPIQPAIQPVNPQMMPAQQVRPVVRPRRRHRYLPWLLVILLIVIVLAAAVYFVPSLRTMAASFMGPPKSTATLVPVQETPAPTSQDESTDADQTPAPAVAATTSSASSTEATTSATTTP